MDQSLIESLVEASREALKGRAFEGSLDVRVYNRAQRDRGEDGEWQDFVYGVTDALDEVIRHYPQDVQREVVRRLEGEVLEQIGQRFFQLISQDVGADSRNKWRDYTDRALISEWRRVFGVMTGSYETHSGRSGCALEQGVYPVVYNRPTASLYWLLTKASLNAYPDRFGEGHAVIRKPSGKNIYQLLHDSLPCGDQFFTADGRHVSLMTDAQYIAQIASMASTDPDQLGWLAHIARKLLLEHNVDVDDKPCSTNSFVYRIKRSGPHYKEVMRAQLYERFVIGSERLWSDQSAVDVLSSMGHSCVKNEVIYIAGLVEKANIDAELDLTHVYAADPCQGHYLCSPQRMLLAHYSAPILTLKQKASSEMPFEDWVKAASQSLGWIHAKSTNEWRSINDAISEYLVDGDMVDYVEPGIQGPGGYAYRDERLGDLRSVWRKGMGAEDVVDSLGGNELLLVGIV